MTKDYGKVFDDIMVYVTAKVPTPPEGFQTKGDLQRYLERADRIIADQKGTNKKMSGLLFNQILDTPQAERVIEEGTTKTKKLTPIQQRVVQEEIRRPTRVRIIDESKTVKDKKRLLDINQKNFGRWKKNPSRYDLNKVDTKTREFIKTFVRQKTNTYQRQGLKVYNDRDVNVFVVRRDKKQRLYAQDVITGRRVGKKRYSRFGKSLNDLK